MEIRKGTAEDLDELVMFYNRLIDDMKDSPYAPRWEKDVYPIRSDFEKAASAGGLYLAEINHQIAGAFVLTHGMVPGYEKVPWKVEADSEKISYLHLLAVDPRLHGQGIGTNILRAMAALCRSHDQKAIRLDVLPHNIPAKELYEYAGFQNLGLLELNYESTGPLMFYLLEYPL